MYFRAPIFPCVWEIKPTILTPGKYWSLSADEAMPGEGFRNIPGRLPRLTTFTDLSAVDLAMAHHCVLHFSGDDFTHLVYARNAAKHKIMSLPPWSKLADLERRWADNCVYECCRLTTVLYANTVSFPTLEDFPGVQEPLRQLRDLLASFDLNQFEGECSAVVLWAVFVGGIASYRTQHWSFFVSALRICKATASIASLEEAVAVLRAFVWSDAACADGAQVVWNASEAEDSD